MPVKGKTGVKAVVIGIQARERFFLDRRFFLGASTHPKGGRRFLQGDLISNRWVVTFTASVFYSLSGWPAPVVATFRTWSAQDLSV